MKWSNDKCNKFIDLCRSFKFKLAAASAKRPAASGRSKPVPG